MAHIRLDKIENGVFIIPLDRDSWVLDKNHADTPSNITFNDDGTINLKYQLIKYKNKNYLDIYNKGYKYIRFDYDRLNFSSRDAIFCIGVALWNGNEYRGGNEGWYFQCYMATGTYCIMNMVNRTYESDGGAYFFDRRLGLTNKEEITLGMNNINNIHVRRVALADSIEKLRNLPKNY